MALNLPLSRNTTYVAGVSQVKSEDLNDIQDKIIDAESGTLRLTAADAMIPTLLPADINAGAILSKIGSTGTATFPIPLKIGKQINAVTLDILEANAGGEEITANLWSIDAAGAAVQVGLNKVSGTSGAGASLGWTTADTGVPFTIGGLAYYLTVSLAPTSGGGESRVYRVAYDYDTP